MATARPRLTPALLVLAASTLGGCLVGPNYYGPPPTATIANTTGQFHRAAGAPVAYDPPASRWWPAMNDPELTKLVDEALVNSPTLKEGVAKIRQARAVVKENQTKLLPSGGADADYLHLRLPSTSSSLVGLSGPAGAALGSSGAGAAAATGAAGAAAPSLSLPSGLDLYSAGLDATWEIDVFGGTRRGIENARGQMQADVASFQNSQVELAAEVVEDYANLRDAQNRVALGRAVVQDDREMLRLTLQQRAYGVSDDSNVEQYRSQLAQDAANLVSPQVQVVQDLDQLALLTGQEAGSLDAELAAPRPVPLPPTVVSIGDARAMLRRRPDIRQAERTLAADNATIGQNVASYFPKVNFFGSLAFGSDKLSNLLNTSNLSGLVAPSISWDVFSFPQTTAKVREAKAQRDYDIANYEQTVLTALQDAEDQLGSFGRQRDSVRQLTVFSVSAVRTEMINRQRYAGQTADQIDVLSSDRQKLQAEQNLSQSTATMTDDYAALQKSLGLGWQGAPAPGPLPRMPGAVKISQMH